MKKFSIYYLSFIFFAICSINMKAQSWSAGTSSLYANPTSTNVGIGTSSPNSRLHVNAASGQNGFRVQLNGSSKFTVASNGGASIGAFQDTPPANGLYVSGKIGVGISNPESDLELFETTQSGIKFWGRKYVDYDFNTTTYETIGARSGVLQFYHPEFADGEVPLGGWTQLRCGSVYTVSGSTGESLISLTGAGEIKIKNNFKVNSSGHVYARKIVVTTSTFPDYVFSSKYNLMPLNELKTYINKNKHLPNIKSETEVVEEGIDIGELNKILLEKVEELTLYVIDLQEQIDSMKQH